LPKIESTNAGESDTTARIRLLRMLAVARKLPLNQADLARLGQQGHTLLAGILRLFCNSALLLARRGPLPRDGLREENLQLVKGRLEFAGHVARNSARRDRAYCAFDEFSPDNTPNRTIKAAAVRAAEASSAPDLQALVRELIYCLDEISDVEIGFDAYRRIPN